MPVLMSHLARSQGSRATIVVRYSSMGPADRESGAFVDKSRCNQGQPDSLLLIRPLSAVLAQETTRAFVEKLCSCSDGCTGLRQDLRILKSLQQHAVFANLSA